MSGRGKEGNRSIRFRRWSRANSFIDNDDEDMDSNVLKTVTAEEQAHEKLEHAERARNEAEKILEGRGKGNPVIEGFRRLRRANGDTHSDGEDVDSPVLKNVIAKEQALEKLEHTEQARKEAEKIREKEKEEEDYERRSFVSRFLKNIQTVDWKSWENVKRAYDNSVSVTKAYTLDLIPLHIDGGPYGMVVRFNAGKQWKTDKNSMTHMIVSSLKEQSAVAFENMRMYQINTVVHPALHTRKVMKLSRITIASLDNSFALCQIIAGGELAEGRFMVVERSTAGISLLRHGIRNGAFSSDDEEKRKLWNFVGNESIRRLALAMSQHERLGKCSPLKQMPIEKLEAIACMLTTPPNKNTLDDVFNWLSSHEVATSSPPVSIASCIYPLGSFADSGQMVCCMRCRKYISPKASAMFRRTIGQRAVHGGL